jgi:UMF1 family MFS transporter
MYDWANSAYTTLIVTFVYATFFTKVIAPDEIVGTTLWSWGVTITAISVALLAPIMGAVADRGGYRKFFLFVMTVIAVIGSAALYFVMPGETTKALIWFVIGNIAFEMGGVFYNAFLPEIAPEGKIGRVSGFGWGLGYVGGLICMFIAMLTMVNPEVPWFGLTKEAGQHIRATNILVAIWFALFSIPLFLWVKENKRLRVEKGNVLFSGWRQLIDTFVEIRKYREIVKFLLARLIYNDGLVTIFAFGGIYAAGTFGFTFEEIMVFGIVLNITAGLGAFAMGFFDDYLGGKKTIAVSLVALTVAGVIAVLAPSKTLFWVAGIIVGLFSGPNQAASRSLLGRFVPPDKENEFFGFFAFSGKATAFLGPFLLGILTNAFGSQRAGVSIVILFFVVGGLFLSFVNEKAGIVESKIP